MSDELAEVSIAYPRGERSFPVQGVAHRIAERDKPVLVRGCNRISGFPKHAGVIPFRLSRDCLGMTADRRTIRGRRGRIVLGVAYCTHRACLCEYSRPRFKGKSISGPDNPLRMR